MQINALDKKMTAISNDDSSPYMKIIGIDKIIQINLRFEDINLL